MDFSKWTIIDFQQILVTIWSCVSGLLTVIYWYLEALYRQFIPPPMKSISGETILVTGAVGGIGQELCRYLVRCSENLKLVIWDLNQGALENFAKELEQENGSKVKVYPFQVDITQVENVERAAKLVKDTVGSVSIVFNNAGVLHHGNFLQLTSAQCRNTIEVNLLSHMWITKQFLPDMVRNNHGRIINTCSTTGLMPGPYAAPYFASKFVVNGFTECLKLELELFKYDGIHVTAVYPHFVRTPILNSLNLKKEILSEFPLPRFLKEFLEPKQVAKQIVDGMRREYERIYLPSIFPIGVVLFSLMPNKLRKLIYAKCAAALQYSNKYEHKKVMGTTYLELISTMNL